jgi:hypothetical protein
MYGDQLFIHTERLKTRTHSKICGRRGLRRAGTMWSRSGCFQEPNPETETGDEEKYCVGYVCGAVR